MQVHEPVCCVCGLMAFSEGAGTLPLAWGLLSNLQHLTLHENLLAGAISKDCHDPRHACHTVAQQKRMCWQWICRGIEHGFQAWIACRPSSRRVGQHGFSPDTVSAQEWPCR